MLETLPDWTRKALDRIREGGPAVLLVGLTGGIGTGKSTVGGMLRELGASVLDADRLVHDLLAPGGSAVGPVLERFGVRLGDGSGGVDRRALGSLVFADPDARKTLEQIVHPLVIAESERMMARMAATAGGGMVVYDAALLVETGRYRRFDRLLVVTCDREVQLRRLMDRSELSADEAGARIRAQMPVEEKAALADYVVDNSGPWHQTRRAVEKIFRALEADATILRAALR